jgi:hypothetical protein
MILREDEKIATVGSGEGPDRWRSVRPRPWVIVWFVLWAISVVLLSIGMSFLGRTDETDLPSRGSVMNGYVVFIVAALIGAVTAAVAALTVRHLTRLDLGERAARPGWEPGVGSPAAGWAEPRQSAW